MGYHWCNTCGKQVDSGTWRGLACMCLNCWQEKHGTPDAGVAERVDGEQEPAPADVTDERPSQSAWRDQRLEGWYADGGFYVGATLYITPYPDGIRVICGDLDRLHAMSPKAMRGFAIRLLEMAECER